MNVAVDIGNTNLKCFVPLPNGDSEFRSWTIPLNGDRLDHFVMKKLLYWGAASSAGKLMPDVYPEPITWQMIQTGKLSWQDLKAEILKIRPKDQFKLITWRQIPADILEIGVIFPEKVGIDRLLAAFAAVKHYGNSPMLIVDAGSALTVDIVYDQLFNGGAILPGLTALSNVCALISDKLPRVSIPAYPESCKTIPPIFPGRNTEDAIQSGLYWGTVGAIRQLYEMTIARTKKLRLLVTGGDAEYLLHGLVCVIPRKRISHHDMLALEGMTYLS